MLTWSNIKAIITQYDADKGAFRSFFNTQSEYITQLSAKISSHQSTSTISLKDCFALTRDAFVYAASKQGILSSRMAIKVVLLCTCSSPELVTSWKRLHTAGVLSYQLFHWLRTNPDLTKEFIQDLKQASEHVSDDNLRSCFTAPNWLQSSIAYRMGALKFLCHNWGDAARWYQQDAKRGNVQAMLGLVDIYTDKSKLNDIQQGLTWCRQIALMENVNDLVVLKSITDEHVQVARYMAELYDIGRGGVPRNKQTATHYYQKASRLNCLQADIWLAQYFEEDQTAAQHEQKAVYFLKKAANQLHLLSIKRLFEIYQTGWKSIPYNLKIALGYAQSSADLGD